MGKRDCSIIRKINTSDLIDIVNISSSYSDVIKRLDLTVKTNYIIILKEVIAINNINTDCFKENLLARVHKNKKQYHEIFCVDSKVCSGVVKKNIIKDGLLKYRCAICDGENIHNNMSLTLQLDHINGNRYDNRLENLRWLCPNCHSQTDTYTGKNFKRDKRINLCVDCGKIINKASVRCVGCTKIKMVGYNIKFEVSKEELERLILEKPMTEIGKMFGVSDNAVKKRCKRLGVELKDMRGYWSKKKAGKI